MQYVIAIDKNQKHQEIIHEWTDHYILDDWLMQKRNGNKVVLSLEQLDKIENALKMPKSRMALAKQYRKEKDKMIEDDLWFVKKAKWAIKKGGQVHYISMQVSADQ